MGEQKLRGRKEKIKGRNKKQNSKEGRTHKKVTQE